eukprot:3104117-Alexandrium_andersonii.AAC.1
MVERNLRPGVLPAGAFDLRPGPAGRPGVSTGPMTVTTSSACWARGDPTSLRGARRALTGAASTRTSTTHAWALGRWLRGRAWPARA